MSDSDSFLKQLLARRVPQIIGLYIAATWMTVEIGEWVTEQLGLSGNLVFYAFVLMVTLLPAVAVLAWNHGAPGRDRSPRSEKLFVSANAAVALVLLLVVAEFSPVSSVAEAQGATVERVLVDETGQEQVFQVAREGFHQRVSTAFWTAADSDHDESADWESYAIAWLIGLDLNRDPLLSAVTPFSQKYTQKLKDAGFEQAVGEPLALALQLARESRSTFLVRGQYEYSDSGYRLTARIYRVSTGRQIEEQLAEGASLTAAVDRLAEQIGQSLTSDLERNDESFITIDLAEAATADREALIELTNGLTAWMLDNDYPTAIARLETALEMDPEFAQAYYWLHSIHRLNGDLAAAGQATRDALRLDYKFDTESLFILRANEYAIDGDLDKAIRVLDMWTEVHPENEQAWLVLAQNLLFVGSTDEARTALLEAQRIDPDNPTILRQLANTEELAGNFTAATRLMQDYLDEEPDDQAAWLALANMHLRNGQFDQARETFESAGFVGTDSFAAELGLIRVETYGGNLEQAERMLDRMLNQDYQGTELAQLVFDKSQLLIHVGRPNQALALIQQYDQPLRQSLAPIIYTMNITEVKGKLLTVLNQDEVALDLIQDLKTQTSPPVSYFLQLSEIAVLEHMGAFEQARQLYEETAAYFQTFDFPGREGILLQAEARVLAMQQRYVEASDKVQVAFEQTRKTILGSNVAFRNELQLSAARYLLAAEQLESARDAIQLLLNIQPNHAAGQLVMAEIELAAGNRAQALEILDRLMDQWSSAEPDYSLLLEAQSLLNANR